MTVDPPTPRARHKTLAKIVNRVPVYKEEGKTKLGQ